MKIVALLLVAVMASGAHSEKSYLPPGPGITADGPGFVQVPGLFSGAYKAQFQGGAAAGSYRDYSLRGGQSIAITRYENQNIGDGSYRYNYQTANGISAEEAGAARGGSQSVSGSFSYTGTDGLQYAVHYTADENGFHPEGAHLPTPPPIPEEIRRGVELSLAAEARGENQGGRYRPELPQVYNKYQSSAVGSGGYSY